MEKNMAQEFILQNYLIIEQNVVNNVVVWDGNTTSWTPPQGSIVLVQTTTPAMIWQAVLTDGKITDFVLTEILGAGSIGFTWDGTNCITNEPKPAIPQITTTGTLTA